MKKNKDIIQNARYSFRKLSKEPRISKEYIRITDKILKSWQNIVDTMAEMMNVPSALIMKADHPYIEVLCSSVSKNNPYKAGDRELLTGLYCEEVIKNKDRLIVPNARRDKKWEKNPDMELGMISYLGFPIFWPDGDVFGTICVLDSKENTYGERYEELMLNFKEFTELHLSLLFQDLTVIKNLVDILDNLTEGIIAHNRDRRILFFNRAAEEITGYSRKNVLGKDCHEAFGVPLCGARCAFKGVSPDYLEKLNFPINIITKEGQTRRLEMNINMMSDEVGILVGVIASFRDVTDLMGLKIQVGDLEGFAGIIGRDPKMLKVYRQIADMAGNQYPVHITGETGTGKELVAAAIHNESRRGGGPFVPVNCGALPEGILESELFGHVKGAFTGAVRDKKGRFELANGGTLFLDEVADLPKVVQAKLLRVLQEGTFERVGGEETVSTDVRLISAANRDLKREVEKGNFRDDLYYRINVVPIHLPALREHKNDIPLLAEHFLKEAALEEGQETLGLAKESLGIMIEYTWPGNVRELQSAIRFALVNARGRIIKPDNLPMELQEWKHSRSTRAQSRKKLDTESVKAALTRSGGNKARASRILGVGRATLYRFLADFPDLS
jgi:sigma-54 dependent transcriptional regulator, acetoin dehydrogenase operon transcriptional activator AcoR